MNRLLISAAGLAAMVSSASAADLAARSYTKAPPMVAAAIYDWSGFYIGINGGGGSSRKCWDITNGGGIPFVPAFGEGCHDATGGTVGGQIGYRWQSAAWVFGLEAQGNWADFRGSNSSLFFTPPPGVFANRSRIDGLGLFTGQVGYSWNTFLLYVKGGAAVTNDKYEGYFATPFIFPAGTVIDRASETRWGGVIGVGGEFSFTQNWSFGLEYDHLFMGNRSIDFTATGAFTAPPGVFSRTDSIRQDVDMFTARVNYRFGPVVARY